MKKSLLSLTLVVFLLANLISTNTANATVNNPNNESNVVYYIPHQDDEALSFGLSIMNHLQGGHNVHVVLITDGSASKVKRALGMTDREFSEARNREFAKSLQIMGVKSENVSYRGIKDGTVTVAQMEKIILEYETKYPNAKHKSFSWTDPHNDHKNSGLALRNLQKKGKVNDARYYVKQQDNPKGVRLVKEGYKSYYAPFFRAVGESYRMENKVIGFYGIGYKSVAKSFISFEERAVSRYHK